MGYSTTFYGNFEFSRQLTLDEKNELDKFASERHEGVIRFSDWCDWIPNKEGTHLRHNGSEKFYEYTEWLRYLIKNFFEPWGVKLNGSVEWAGEDSGDIGEIRVKNNEVKVATAKITFEEE